MSGPSGCMRSSSPAVGVRRREQIRRARPVVAGEVGAHVGGELRVRRRERSLDGVASGRGSRQGHGPASARRRPSGASASRAARAPMSRHVVSFPPATDTIPPRPARDHRLAPGADRARPACREDAHACEPRPHERGREDVRRQRAPRLGQDLRERRRRWPRRPRGRRRRARRSCRGGASPPTGSRTRRGRRGAASSPPPSIRRRRRGRGARPSTEGRSSRRPGPRAGGRGRPMGRPRSRPSGPSTLTIRPEAGPRPRPRRRRRRARAATRPRRGSRRRRRRRRRPGAPRSQAARRGSGGRGRAPCPRRPVGDERRHPAARGGERDAAVSAVGEPGERAVEEDAGAHLPERPSASPARPARRTPAAGRGEGRPCGRGPAARGAPPARGRRRPSPGSAGRRA